MKKNPFWIYISLIIFELVLGLSYGFLLRNFIPKELFFLFMFAVPLIILLFMNKHYEKLTLGLKEILLFSGLFAVLSIITFTFGNQLNREFIGEYDVVVEDVFYKGGGTAYFTTPDGNEGMVELNDYRHVMSIIIDDNSCVEIGDKITVKEYKGCFDELYYVFVKEVD